MPNEALVAVLFGALLHASWNAVIKSGPDQRLDTVLVATGAGVIAAAFLPMLPQPAAESLPYLGVSAVLQVIYFALLAATYRIVDLSLAYPLMRGAPPLIVAAASGALIGEVLSARAFLGVALISGSVLALALLTRRTGAGLKPVGLALANAVVIAGYTLVDGIGARLSGAVASYTLWLSLLTAPPLLVLAARRNAHGLAQALRARWWVALCGGLATLGSYGLALWAMTRAPIATTAALRETSILFGMLIAAVALKEPVGPARIAVGIAIAAGAAMLRLS
jgi:drug/metabolite transporter (DMT)-like permease